MNRTALLLLFGLTFFTCSEPYEFDTVSGDVIVVDALVSTAQGKSKVIIYSIEGEDRVDLDDLDVKVIDGDGLEYDFTYDAASLSYQPLNPGFVGLIGNKYRFEASSSGEVLFSSLYDSISAGVDFGIQSRDTTILEISGASNSLVPRSAAAAIAIISNVERTVYSKFEFSYSFQDFWSRETVEVPEQDEFVLFTNLNGNNELNSISIPIGAKIRTPWFFWDQTQPPGTCLDSAVCGNDPCCGNICCEFFNSWPAELIITQESLSASTFQFWENVEKLRNNDGLVFDTFPFPVEGNVTCANCEVEVVGLFRAVAESSQAVNVIL